MLVRASQIGVWNVNEASLHSQVVVLSTAKFHAFLRRTVPPDTHHTYSDTALNKERGLKNTRVAAASDVAEAEASTGIESP